MTISELQIALDQTILEYEHLQDAVLRPNWQTPKYNHFWSTLYGLVMRYASFVDVCSVYAYGGKMDQSTRMSRFLQNNVGYQADASKVAVKIWRHSLMHQASPTVITHTRSGSYYRWLLYWDDEKLGNVKHMTIIVDRDQHI